MGAAKSCHAEKRYSVFERFLYLTALRICFTIANFTLDTFFFILDTTVIADMHVTFRVLF